MRLKFRNITAKLKRLKAMHVKFEKRFEGNRSGQPSGKHDLPECMKEASKDPRRRTEEPLPETQKRGANLRRHQSAST